MTSALTERYKREATQWARDLFELPRFIIMDTETTGLEASDEVCSVGIIDGQGNVLLDSLVRPSKPIPYAATRIHGIRDRDVADAPTFPDLYPAIADLLGQEVLVVYNLSFDRRLLNQSQAIHRLPALRYHQAHCAMLQYAQFYGDWNYRRGSYRWQALGDACYQCGIPPVNTHSAIGDCLLTRHILLHMAAH